MSLHVLADHMASKGRNGDSMLVHMTPGEVAGLHALALKHGGELTINPDTGLPEANFLKSLLPMLAGAALNFFVPGLGAAVGGAFGLGAAAGTGIAVGGLTTLATGSLSRGLMAGMGAYGGAGLAEGFMGAGVGAAQQGAMGSLSADQIASEMANTELTKQGVLNQAAADATKSALADPGSTFSAGLKSAAANPLDFAKANFKPLAAAAGPIMADMMVPTTTKMPTNTNPAYIRQYVTGDRPQAPRALTPVLATEFGSRNFSDAYGSPMATGGIVALARGGVPRYDGKDGSVVGGDAALAAYQAGNYGEASRLLGEAGMNAQDVVSKYGLSQADAATVAQNLGYKGDMSGIQYTAPPTAQTTAAAAPTYTQYSDEAFGAHLAKYPNADLAKDLVTYNADPAAFNRYIASLTSPFVGSTDTTGGSGTLGIYNRMLSEGVDPNEYYKAALANDPKYAGWGLADIQRGYNLDKGAYALSAAEKDGVSDKEWVKFMDDNGYSINDMAQAFGLSRNEVKARYDAAKKEEKKTTIITNTGATTGNVTGTLLPTNPQTNAPPGTRNPYGNINNPGDLTFNNDGTVTVQPNLPGRPYGGYSGITELTNAYTAGGGSTGYISPVVGSAFDHDIAYNKQTEDSLDAYNYLIGKGGAKYPSKSRATEIMKPYEEAVLGYAADPTKKKFINVGGKMVKNPQYVEPTSKITKPGDPNVVPKETPRAGYQWGWNQKDKKWEEIPITAVVSNQNDGGGGGDGGDMANGGVTGYALGGLGTLGGYSDGGRLLKGPGDGVSDSIPATIGAKNQPARLADGEFVIPARIVSELGNGSTDAGARKLYAMMDRVQRARGKTTGRNKVAANSRSDKYLPA